MLGSGKGLSLQGAGQELGKGSKVHRYASRCSSSVISSKDRVPGGS